MVRLEQLKPGLRVDGIVPGETVTITSVERIGDSAASVGYRRADGSPAEELFFRDREASLSIASESRRWSFDGDGRILKLASEAYRIQLAHLFDTRLAVHTSLIEPLPHQISAVYDHMLTRQPLRFLLADDPGAGKTIMAGLLIKELITRGDVRRCLICAPGNLTEQWQDELGSKFQLEFTIVTRDLIEATRSGNPFADNDQLIIRLDQISRNEQLQTRLERTDWDLIVCDEAHKMSAAYFGAELRETKRHRLGKRLGKITRHLLLMTATPHNGKREDFELFMRLLDPERFEGRPSESDERSDVSDLMRRMIKEKLLTFEGRRLFPERKATSVDYELSGPERALYEAVTNYVREEFNKAEKLEQGGRRSSIGFALTILQRRLASSPAAIYQSLRRRRERLRQRLKDARAGPQRPFDSGAPSYDREYLLTLDDAPDSEVETIEAELIDHATAAQTIAQLEDEIALLQGLEEQALHVQQRGRDSKWLQLLSLLQEVPELKAGDGRARKLVIFTEHRDTLEYLVHRLQKSLGVPEAVVAIHGSVRREQRREIVERFRGDGDIEILVATDAAGEGINLQSAHLMVNYDLPWNPNRLEQRFGRIHRIGQREVCHLWNLVAGETREGAVYKRLLEKLANERETLDGQVFDVLGELFREKPLRQLLMEAVRGNNDPKTRARHLQQIDNTTDQERVRAIVRDDLLVSGVMDTSKVVAIREDMERANARRLQPHFIKVFFEEAFAELGGRMHKREGERCIINNVPAALRQHAAANGIAPLRRKYKRVCFDKDHIHLPGKDDAELVCPGHPLLDGVISMMLERHRDILQRGAVLIDQHDPGIQPRALIYLQGSIKDATRNRDNEQTVISKALHFVTIGGAGDIQPAGAAPYLDYQPATPEQMKRIAPMLTADWLGSERLEQRATQYAIERLVQPHLAAINEPRDELLGKTERAVQQRMTRAINYWDMRARQLEADESAGKSPGELNSARARQRADDLQARLEGRLDRIALERQISAGRPTLAGAALIVPIGALDEQQAENAIDTRVSERIAMGAVMDAERALGNEPIDVSAEKVGYDILSKPGAGGQQRFIEVKGRRAGAQDITLTHNELLTARNSPEQYILAVVVIDEQGRAADLRYVRDPANQRLQATSMDFSMRDLLDASHPPG